ncbi:unnamed protein product [Nippostrongylus brasiliensis]|uniref:STI1 domain-containing protein n=1 Tax=Nippostrongylus brasiliensis TaxID=27835 RepID=A0A0N4YSP1_NIPBR|nr:unnamed protein product [Nippostrongylus brasiliensis]
MVGFNTPSMMQPGMPMHPGMGQMRNQLLEGGGTPMQQQPQPGQQQQQQQQQQSNPALTDPAMAHVVNRFKMAKTDEEKQSAFQELKKTPHLFAAFIKMKPNSEMVGGNWPSNMGPGGLQPGFYGGPPQQGGVRGQGGQFAPMGPGGWQQQQQQQQQQYHQQRQPQGQSPAISGQQFGVGQGRSPSMGMGSSPMLPPQQAGQPDQSGQFR